MHLDIDLIGKIINASSDRPSDIDALDGVIRLLRRELERAERSTLTDSDLESLTKAYRVLCVRVGVQGERLPFRDWTEYWRWRRRERFDDYGDIESAEAQDDYWDNFFNELEQHVQERVEATWFHDLLNAVSPLERTGWNAVDNEISELRKRFANARTAADHSAVGHQCVRVIEKLAIAAFEYYVHGSFASGNPSPTDTKNRFEAVISAHASGRESELLRKIAKDAVNLAQDVKHRHTPGRADAGIAADAVIFLANVLRRLRNRPVTQKYP